MCVRTCICVYCIFFNTLACLVVENRFESPDNRRQNRERVPTTACTMGRVTSGFSLTFKKLAPPVFLALTIWEKNYEKSILFYVRFVSCNVDSRTHHDACV